jgi:nucleotide-binding universal stress UspA family protein
MVPVDFSSGAMQALDYAVGLARRIPGAEIILMHAIEPIVFPAREPRGRAPDHDAWKKAVDERLDAVIKKTRSKGRLKVRTVVRTGRAYQEIVRAASSAKADLIVLGSAGYTATEYSEFGSTAERVARKAPCPVLLVRDKGA